MRDPLYLDFLYATREALATVENHFFLSRETGRDWPYKGAFRQPEPGPTKTMPSIVLGTHMGLSATHELY